MSSTLDRTTATWFRFSRLRRLDLATTLVRATWLAALAACGAMQPSPPTGTSPRPAAVVASVPVGRGPTLLATPSTSERARSRSAAGGSPALGLLNRPACRKLHAGR